MKLNLNNICLLVWFICGLSNSGFSQNKADDIKDSVIIAWKNDNTYSMRKRVAIDTSNLNFQNYAPNSQLSDYKVSLGAFGSPAVDLQYTQLTQKPFYLQGFEKSLYSVDNMLQYTAKQPFTDVFYSVAKNQEQQVAFIHTQNYNKDLNIGFKLNFYQSLGEYLPQEIHGKHIAPWLTYTGSNFSTYFKFTHNVITYDENGGILHDSLLQKVFITTKLNNASTKIKYQDALFIQKWCLKENEDYVDSNSIELPKYPIALGYRLDYTNSSKYFTDEKLKTANYYQVLFDSTATVDTAIQKDLKNTVFLEFNTKNKDKSQVFQFGVGYDYKNTAYRDYNLSYPQIYDNSLFYKGNYVIESIKSKFLLHHEHSYYFYGNYTNDLYVQTQCGKSFVLPNNKEIQINVMQKFDSYKPHGMYAQFLSNHYDWNRVNTNEIVQQYRAEIYSQVSKIQASIDWFSIKNQMFFSSLGTMEQSNKTSNAVVCNAKKQTDFWIFSLQNGILWQKYNSNGNEFPAWATYNSIAIHDIIYKNLVDFRLGVEGLYYPKYFSPAYNPSLALYTVQHTIETGGVPYINGFLSIKYKPIRILVKYNGIYAQFAEKNFIIPHYPQQSGYITFAVSWLFYN